MTHPVNNPNPPTITQLDIIVFTDLRFPGGTSSSLAAEVHAAVDNGYRVGIMHVESPRLSRGSAINDEVRGLFESGLAQLILPGESVHTQLAIVKHPIVFSEPIGARLPISADVVIVTVGQVPADIDGTVYYEPVSIDRSITKALGTRPAWFPVSAVVREQLDDVHCAETDWVEVIDIDQWRRHPGISDTEHEPAPSDSSHNDRPPVIGRHSRPDPLKWPSDADELRAAYPTDGSAQVHVLGGADAVANVLGAVPADWDVTAFGEQDPRAFLEGIDVFVYHHHPDLIEAFGRTVLEALAAGVPVVVPSHFEAIFGDACLYATPADTAEAVRLLTQDRRAREAQLARADRVLADRFSPTALQKSINDLIGPPRIGEGPLPRGVPWFDAIPVALQRQYTTSLITFLGADSAAVESLLLQIDRHRRHAPGFIPVIVVTIRVPPLAAELGIEVCVVSSRRNWTKTKENWDDYAIRRIRQLARNYRVDNVVPFDTASADAWISLQVSPPNNRVNG